MPRTLALALFLLAAGAPAASAAEPLAIEKEVAALTQSEQVTVVHFWASWCPNCQAELRGGGWKRFIEANPAVNFVFITVRDEKSGAAELARHGIGPQKNFRHLQHPNSSRVKGEEMTSFMDMRVGWVPATWVFRVGRLRYALNYGQVRFEILRQLVEDAQPRWD